MAILQTSTEPGLNPFPGGGYKLNPRGPLPQQPKPPDPYGPDPTGNAAKQGDQLANPPNVDIKTAPNPFQTEAYGDAKKFADSLADRSNASITNSMQRQRDVGAGAIADVVAQAGRHGGATGSGLSGVLASRENARNQAQVAKTGADLTDVALNRETQARALEMGGATDIAKDQSDMFGKQADLYLGGRKADIDRADYYAREREARFQRAADVAKLALSAGAAPGDAMGGGVPGAAKTRQFGETNRGIAGGGAPIGTRYPSDVAGSPYIGGR